MLLSIGSTDCGCTGAPSYISGKKAVRYCNCGFAFVPRCGHAWQPASASATAAPSASAPLARQPAARRSRPASTFDIEDLQGMRLPQQRVRRRAALDPVRDQQREMIVGEPRVDGLEI